MLIYACFTFTGITNNGYIEQNTRSHSVRYNRVLTVFPRNSTLKSKAKQSSYTPRWRLGDRRYSSYSFTTSALDGVSGQLHAPTALFPGERTPGTHCTGGWVGPRPGLDTGVRGKNPLPLPGIEPRSPGRPVRSQTLY
jgi:hypothetical protein